MLNLIQKYNSYLGQFDLGHPEEVVNLYKDPYAGKLIEQIRQSEHDTLEKVMCQLLGRRPEKEAWNRMQKSEPNELGSYTLYFDNKPIGTISHPNDNLTIYKVVFAPSINNG